LLTHTKLKARQRKERSTFPIGLSLRVHRSLSWLDRAEQCEDLDGKFVFLWISFNAAYANEIVENYRLSEKKSFKNFIEKIVRLDTSQTLHNIIWNNYSGSIRVLLANPYVSAAFWEMQIGNLDKDGFESQFKIDKERAFRALIRNDTVSVIICVLESIYMLRNQIFHGGATWNSSINRDQIRDASRIMQVIVPLVLTIMMDNSSELWGDAIFPVIENINRTNK
jgi:hypothetical protein